jgi:hypothetical protein
MKVRVLMATLVITLLLGVQGFASPCDSACVDPCAACNGNVAKCDLFSGLKKLVNGVRTSGCNPCDAVVACSPCDDASQCNPCDEVSCCDFPKIGLGGRLRGLFASQACYTPCSGATDCQPCDQASLCDPCGNAGCDGGCSPKFALRGLFSGLRLRGCASDCGPCDVVGDCGPCDQATDCGACDACGTSCGPRGHLLDLPRISLKKLFSGVRFAGCCDDGGCNPCDNVRDCLPCDRCSR